MDDAIFADEEVRARIVRSYERSTPQWSLPVLELRLDRKVGHDAGESSGRLIQLSFAQVELGLQLGNRFLSRTYDC